MLCCNSHNWPAILEAWQGSSIVMLVIKVMMFMPCLIFCSESSVIISCFISLFSCQCESKIL